MGAPIIQQAINLDMSAEIFGEPFDLQAALNGFSVQAFFSGAPNGTLVLEGRNSLSAGFTQVGGAAFSLAVSAAGNQMFEYGNANFREARLHWLPTGGSGLLSAYWFSRRA